MTIDDIANFFRFTGCQVTLGSTDTGSIQIADTESQGRANFSHYLSFNEMPILPSPKAILPNASIFKVHPGRRGKNSRSGTIP